jgi:hypothetical protein
LKNIVFFFFKTFVSPILGKKKSRQRGQGELALNYRVWESHFLSVNKKRGKRIRKRMRRVNS